MPDPNLRSAMLRIASELPVGDPARQAILAELKQAGAGHDVMYELVGGRRAFVKLHSGMRKVGDEQSADLLRDITKKFGDIFDLNTNEAAALNHLRGCVENQGRWPADLQRNNIFKAANLLGIRLPSAIFASDQSKQAGRGYAKHRTNYTTEVTFTSVTPSDKLGGGISGGSEVWDVKGKVGIHTLTGMAHKFWGVMYVPPNSPRAYFSTWNSDAGKPGSAWLMRAVEDLIAANPGTVADILRSMAR